MAFRRKNKTIEQIIEDVDKNFDKHYERRIKRRMWLNDAKDIFKKNYDLLLIPVMATLISSVYVSKSKGAFENFLGEDSRATYEIVLENQDKKKDGGPNPFNIPDSYFSLTVERGGFDISKMKHNLNVSICSELDSEIREAEFELGYDGFPKETDEDKLKLIDSCWEVDNPVKKKGDTNGQVENEKVEDENSAILESVSYNDRKIIERFLSGDVGTLMVDKYKKEEREKYAKQMISLAVRNDKSEDKENSELSDRISVKRSARDDNQPGYISRKADDLQEWLVSSLKDAKNWLKGVESSESSTKKIAYAEKDLTQKIGTPFRCPFYVEGMKKGVFKGFDQMRNIYVTSDYYHQREEGLHQATDVASTQLIMAVSPVDGTVVSVDTKTIDSRSGPYVAIKDRYGNRHAFAHLNHVLVRKGDKIKKGKKLGVESAFGEKSTGEHVHYSITAKNGKKVNPEAQRYNIVDMEYEVDLTLQGTYNNLKHDPKAAKRDLGILKKKSIDYLNKIKKKARFVYDYLF